MSDSPLSCFVRFWPVGPIGLAPPRQSRNATYFPSGLIPGSNDISFDQILDDMQQDQMDDFYQRYMDDGPEKVPSNCARQS